MPPVARRVVVPRALRSLRSRCLAFPGAHEVEAWGAPTFRVRNKLFAMYAASGNHHGSGRPGVWIKARSANQDLMVRANPARFFVPPYVGPSGWVGVWLDGTVDWDEVRSLLLDAYLLTAPRKLIQELPEADTTTTTDASPKKTRAAKKGRSRR